MARRIPLLLLFLLITTEAGAATFYVAPTPTGSDSNNGSITAPWATILHAVETSKPGDTVLLRAGTYNESFEFRGDKGHGGASGSYWTLKGYPGETATLTAGLSIYMASYVRVEDLQFKGCGIGVNNWTTGSFGLPHHIEIRNNHFTGNQLTYGYIEVHGDNNTIEGNTIDCTGGGSTLDHGIYVHHGTGKVIRRNHINNVSGYGIHVYDERKSSGDPQTFIQNLVVDGNVLVGSRLRAGIVVATGGDTVVDGVLIANNVVVNNAWSGITIWGTAKNIKVYNNTLHNNGSPAVAIATAASTVAVKNNILVAAQGSHLGNSGGTNVAVDTNLYWPSPAKLSGAQDAHPLTGDPLLAAPPTDLHLKAGSPAIDKGLALAEVTVDQEGKQRPMDGDQNGTAAYDLGAYEYPGKAALAADSGAAKHDRGPASDSTPLSPKDGTAAGDGKARSSDSGCGCAVGGHGGGPLVVLLIAPIAAWCGRRRLNHGARSR